EWVHVQLHQQKGMISLSPPTICNSAAKIKVMFKGDCLILLRYLSPDNYQNSVSGPEWPVR
ncbi:hypothetical protein, partial [Klebsiella sp. 2019SCSN059]|uniref:hypothetical protein n=1 Tax=Klebsiella sp. 2019SCSN059 TaxID=2911173 RepID=UPI001F4215BD